MGEHGHKVQEFFKSRLVDDHGSMLGVEHDAVFVVVHIGAVLQEPLAVCDGQRDDSVVLPGRMIHPAGRTFVFRAQKTLGIAGLGCVLCCRNGLGVLLRLTEVDGNIQVTVLSRGLPTHILLDAVAADIVRILATASLYSYIPRVSRTLLVI